MTEKLNNEPKTPQEMTRENLCDLSKSIQAPQAPENAEVAAPNPQIFADFFGIDVNKIKEVKLNNETKTYTVKIDLPLSFPQDNEFSQVAVECTIPVSYKLEGNKRIYTPKMDLISFTDQNNTLENGKLKIADLYFDLSDLSNPSGNAMNFMKVQYNTTETEKHLKEKISKSFNIDVSNWPETLSDTDQNKLYYQDFHTDQQDITTSNIKDIDLKSSLSRGFVLGQPQKKDEKHYERTITLADGSETAIKITYTVNEKGQLHIDDSSLGSQKELKINGFDFKKCSIAEGTDGSIQFNFDQKELEAYQTYLVDFHKAVFDLFGHQSTNSMADDYPASFNLKEYFARNPNRQTEDIDTIDNIDSTNIIGFYSFKVAEGKYINFSYQNGELLLKDNYGNPTDTIVFNGESRNYTISIKDKTLAIEEKGNKADEYQYLNLQLNGEPLNVQGIYQDGKLRLKDTTGIIAEIPVNYDKKTGYTMETTPATELKPEYFSHLFPKISNDVPMFSQEDMDDITRMLIKNNLRGPEQNCVVINGKTYQPENQNGVINFKEYTPERVQNSIQESKDFYAAAQQIAKVKITKLGADGKTYNEYNPNSGDGIGFKMESNAQNPTFHCLMTNGEISAVDLSFVYNADSKQFDYQGAQQITLGVSQYSVSYDQVNNQIKITPTS